MVSPRLELVSSPEEAVGNILLFESELGAHSDLPNRLSLVHAWYAARTPEGWAFGPSKFVGYKDVNADRYIRTARPDGPADGRRTEMRLEAWFQPVDPETPLGRELLKALLEFLARWGKLPRARVRLNVLNGDFDALEGARRRARTASDKDLLDRILVDPAICGGRPCIKGTRMRVTDIVEMMAQGASRDEIMTDFPYILEKDIAAALAYAARAADHRVIHAA